MIVNSNPTASQQSKKKLDTDDQPLLSNISANFRKNFKWPQLGYSGAWGIQIHEKKPEVENLMSDSLLVHNIDRPDSEQKI